MIVLIERAEGGKVEVDGEVVAEIGRGIVVFVGVEKGDDTVNIDRVAERITYLRIFPDDTGKMNLSVKDVNGEVLLVSNFTLCGDTRKGTRPSYSNAMRPDEARGVFTKLVEAVKTKIEPEKVKSGVFGAMMKVDVANDGPVNLILRF